MRVYINIPENYVAGGVESLYQLADTINQVGGESAILGNCIITGTKGSSNFFTDIPIFSCYKTNNLDNIKIVLKDCLENYKERIKDFSLYRSSIKHHKEQFFNYCKQYFLES